MSLEPALRARIDSLLQSNRVVLFMKGDPSMPQCGFSAKAVGVLDGLGIDYAHVNVLADAEIREGIKAYGDWPTIPQLYIDHELVGGSDIVMQMANSGELHALLGVQAPDRTPPSIEITPAAAKMLREAIAGAGPGYALQVSVDADHRAQLQMGPIDPQAIATDVDGIRAQFDLASASRANGLRIDWVDDERGRGLVIDNPNAKTVKSISAAEAARMLGDGALTLVDVRPAEERTIASVRVPFSVMDGDAAAELENLPKDTPLAFLCHHGRRSAAVAEHFHRLGFTRLHNVDGGIDAWSEQVDPAVPRY
ncbi:Grx4 family monothiol glutaredoxin [Cognatilysobacter lacus]|uniref:Probable monothiol glutaredoxin 2 n=1 Tax=Cognatilysobacter lacus TaxID=1643323 RepID=A0A5D8Z6U5_9GAMM|nr:Grx4 family monothiol glutaredoxin [Lysobacter lacus]TZF90256.1 Grx4 family monothiol glutaredoxin [Lysobacter lacus]